MAFIKRTIFLVVLACLIIAPGRASLAASAVPVCHVSGRVYCSEYGTRYKEPVEVVLVCNGTRYRAPLGEVDGSFKTEVPVGAAYELRVEFSGNGFTLGHLDLTKDVSECGKTIEIYHPGSMLELVWEARAGNGDGMDFKVSDAKTQ